MISKILCIGDSLTYGYGLAKDKAWVNLLGNCLGIEIINKGINGDTTPSMLNRLYENLIKHKPDITFIMGGTNDLLCGRKLFNIVDTIEEMILETLSNNSNVVIGIPPIIIKEMAEELFMPSQLYSYCFSSLPKLRTSLIEVCEKHNVKYVDFYNLSLKNIDKNIFIDGIHLNSLGNTLMKDEALRIFSNNNF